MSRKRRGFPKGFDPDAPVAPAPPKPDAVLDARPKPNTSGKLRVRRPLVRRPPEQKIKRFLASAKKWRPGQSGNPSGRKKGVKITDYRSFVEAARKLSPRALERLREALDLPFSKETARSVLTAAALVLERSWGRAVSVTVDATPPQVAPVIDLSDPAYWEDMTRALKESGALEIPVERKSDEDVVDAEVVEAGATKLIEPPRP